MFFLRRSIYVSIANTPHSKCIDRASVVIMRVPVLFM